MPQRIAGHAQLVVRQLHQFRHAGALQEGLVLGVVAAPVDLQVDPFAQLVQAADKGLGILPVDKEAGLPVDDLTDHPQQFLAIGVIVLGIEQGIFKHRQLRRGLRAVAKVDQGEETRNRVLRVVVQGCGHLVFSCCLLRSPRPRCE
ncbi:hypothetical protein D3C72_1910410 [compost metagenome]